MECTSTQLILGENCCMFTSLVAANLSGRRDYSAVIFCYRIRQFTLETRSHQWMPAFLRSSSHQRNAQCQAMTTESQRKFSYYLIVCFSPEHVTEYVTLHFVLEWNFLKRAAFLRISSQSSIYARRKVCFL